MTEPTDENLPASQVDIDGPGSDPAERVTVTSPEDRLALLETEKQELRDRMLRIAADFENWKKRARKDQADGELRAKESVLREMLDVIDNLERALGAIGDATDPKAVQHGVNLVLRLFQSKLERLDVKAMETKGQPFDPRLHDAIAQVPSSEVPPGSVLSELQKGYRMGDRLLRPASVAVAVAPVAATADGGANTGSSQGS